jgi:hypothetical protein
MEAAMAYVRRHWLSSVLYTLIIAFGLAVALTPILFSGGTIEEAMAQSEALAVKPEPVDPHLYTRVQKLRQELSMTTLDLAAMGCTEESATRVLETLKSWCETNQAALDQHHRDTLQAKAAIREAIRKINVGPTPGSPGTPGKDLDPSIARSLPGLQEDLAELYEQRKTMQDGLASQLETQLDAFQRQVWQSARANTGLPAQLHYVPDLTDEQRQAIHAGLTERSLQESKTQVIANELTWSQKQAVDAARVNQTTKASIVRDVEAAVLPLPDLLKESMELTLDVSAR